MKGRTKANLHLAGLMLGMFGFLLLVGLYVHWRWSECRGVGHGVFYCLLPDN